jgi:hypothetical protein
MGRRMSSYWGRIEKTIRSILSDEYLVQINDIERRLEKINKINIGNDGN